MKKTYLFGIIGMLIVAAIIFALTINRPTEKQAVKRIDEFTTAVNYNVPEDLYDLLSSDLKALITKEGFVYNFADERSYPYITPLFLILDELTLSEDNMSGDISFIVSARLAGEFMQAKLVFEDGDYYITMFDWIIDGSYKAKFELIK